MMCAYKLFDLDKNGYVDVTEFTRVLIGFGYPGGQCKARWQHWVMLATLSDGQLLATSQALFYSLDVDGHGRLSRRNVSFIDDWTRPREETWEEKLGKWQMGTLEETLWLLTFEVSSRGRVLKELVHRMNE